MDSLSSILPKVLRKRGMYVHATASLVTHKAKLWLSAALPAFEAVITVTTLKEGTLTVRCTHSIAVQEVSQLSQGLRDYLEKDCPGAVKEVRIERA